MTDRIEAALAALDKATPGPWEVFEGNEIMVADGTALAELWYRKGWDMESNATLIAAAPDLFDEVIRLRKWQQEALPYLKMTVERFKPKPFNLIFFDKAIAELERLIAEAREVKE